MFPRRGIAGDGQSGVPIASLDRSLALEHVRGTRKPLGHSTGCCEAGSLELGDDGGSGRRGFAGASVLGDARGYGLRELAQNEQGIKACSPKPGSEQRRSAEASTSELGGGDDVVSRTGLTRACSRLLGSTGSFVEFLR